MSNLSFAENNSSISFSLMSLDELLDSLGFSKWLSILTLFVLPILISLGLTLCSMSLWIFLNKRKFKDSRFFYYRLLCLVYILHQMHSIIHGLFGTPQLYPQQNTYFTAIFKIYYAIIINILHHFENAIQIAILMDRIAIFSPWVKSHFNRESPRKFALFLLITCICIDLPYSFSLKIKSFGQYYVYSDNTHTQVELRTIYFVYASDFSLTLFGQILIGITTFFFNFFLSLVAGVTLNVVSVHMYRSYLRQRDIEFRRVIITTINDSSDESSRVEVTVPRKRSTTSTTIEEIKSERKTLLMAFTLCSITIIARTLLLFGYVFCFPVFTIFTNMIVMTMNYLITSIVAILTTFVFYSFDKIFRNEFNQRILRMKKLIKS